jgi:hypothetical protein
MPLRLTGAVIAALCLSAPAQAECLSRPSLQPKIFVQINPLAEVLTSIATGKDDTDEAMTRLSEMQRLIREWTVAPPGVDGCRKRVK